MPGVKCRKARKRNMHSGFPPMKSEGWLELFPGWPKILADCLESSPGWLESLPGWLESLLLGWLKSLPGWREFLPGWLESLPS